MRVCFRWKKSSNHHLHHLIIINNIVVVTKHQLHARALLSSVRKEEEDFARHAAHDIDEFYSPVVSRASGDGAEEDLCVIRRWRRW